MDAGDGRHHARPPGRLALLGALAVLLGLGAVLGALVPGAGVLIGLAGGLLAFVATAAPVWLGSWWRRWWAASGLRESQWSRHGPDLVAREFVRAGVGLLTVVFVLGPFVLGGGPLPTWLLAAAATGVACSLPAGVVVELRALRDAGGDADRRRLWRGAIGAAGTAAVGLGLLVALAGLAAWQRALAFSAAAVASFALAARVRGTRWARGRGQAP